ncbi:MAG TPA: hypothetical protein PKN36_10975, partial [bacterium]|nr:hypothetical protein [bacterium]
MDITWSLFPKYYRHLDIGRLAGIAAEAGLESVNVMIRNGYWVSPEGFRKELPIFVKSVKREGLTAQYADIDFSIEHLLEDPALLGVMADNGIKDFRLLYFRMKKEDKNIRSALSDARKFLELLMPLCERYRMRAICQLHHNTLVSSPSAAWNLINGLPETCIGV